MSRMQNCNGGEKRIADEAQLRYTDTTCHVDLPKDIGEHLTPMSQISDSRHRIMSTGEIAHVDPFFFCLRGGVTGLPPDAP